MRGLRRVLARRRRLIAALLAGLAVACVLMAVRQPQGVAVLAAARDLSGGRLTAADVMSVRLPPDAVPDGAFPAGSAVTGRVVAGPVRRGEPLTDARLLGQGLLAAREPGMVAAPVRIADPDAARLLSPGDVIDVLAAFEGDAQQALAVAHAVKVLARPVEADAEGSEAGALLVLATNPAEAAQLAQAQAQARLSVTIHPR
ncbi:Flp pilus assembly protein CpaB [Planotetraspora kaengkrachanensis]|uniref:Flagellar basal body P-ring biosynthesis protein n=1 Tax=Planotetraspora kaengkrachanensis TaxID=575193 RepID=A0A8J3M0R5_9ACTN|nr:Flp pilus assembly protein CpaB [Planotetraspora kaengkrachanensis]GIG79948.1 flagellar basal body P-ring biosynthesis protein [Planotetraspora kaengkrachanensis]